MKQMMVYISGVAGFVGRHFAKRLADEGHYVVGCDDFSTGIPVEQWGFSPELKTSFHISREDFRGALRGSLVASDYDLIIHCAAVVGGRAKIDGDPLAIANNLSIDADFWRWVVRSKNKAQRIVYFSSSAVYPVDLQQEQTHCALSEDLVAFGKRMGMPDQTYGFAKLAGEYLARHAVKTYGTNAVIYRPFSGYGEDQSLDYPFPSIVRRVADKEHPITVWGNGNQVRDWIHISDIVEAVLSTCFTLPAGTTMNLGSGIGTSFRELVTLACELVGHKSVICPQPEKPSGVFRRQADVFFMHQHYKPRITLEEGVARMISYLSAGGGRGLTPAKEPVV